jgi:alkylation response protein AidB-like acyl-CoA dehydrogenase
MIGFDPTEDQALMRNAVAQLAKATLRPRQREFEKARAVPDDVRRAAHEMGLALAPLPESLGGLGLATAVILEEELAWGDPAAAFGFGGPGAMGLALAELATAEQAKKWLAPLVDENGHSRFGAVAWGRGRRRTAIAPASAPRRGARATRGASTARRPTYSTPSAPTRSSSSRRPTRRWDGAGSGRSRSRRAHPACA